MSNHDDRSIFNRTKYKRLLMLLLLACGIILLLTIAKFDSGDHLLKNDHQLQNSMYGNKKDFSNGIEIFNELVFWSSDFHISPIADIKNIIVDYGVRVIDKSLSGHCHLSNTCQHDLRVINQQNGITLGECPNALISTFYESYKNDSELNSVSAFLCTHAASLCELFMPFNKPMIIIASTRFALGLIEMSLSLSVALVS